MLADEWLGRYKILRKIAEGGMGQVYLAQDTKLNRQIAIKVLPAEVSADSQRLHRFIHEAKSASALNHPNIITIYEINEENDVPYIAMEFVSGETLAKTIRNRGLEMRTIFDISVQIASALSAAHAANVIHRDIKPDNIIIRPDGIAKILDFGLAKLTERRSPYDHEANTVEEHKTNPGMIMGTVGYLSPEQARGKGADERSDIFSFGAMLYQMIAGRKPFKGENNLDIIASILHKEPLPLNELEPAVPNRLMAIVNRALRKDAADRFQSIDEMLYELRNARAEFTEDSGGRLFGSADHLVDDENEPQSRTISNAVTEAFTAPDRSQLVTNTFSEMLLAEARQHPLRMFGGLAAVLLLCLSGIFAVNRFVSAKSTAANFQAMRFSKATTSGNLASAQLAVSPNGKMLAYVVRENGLESLWVKQSETSASLKITEPAKVVYDGLAFSPDSNFVTYIIDEPNGTTTLQKIDTLGGTPRKMATDISGMAAYSPDGSRISFIRDTTKLMTANADGTDIKQIAASKDGEQWMLSAWSPDSKSLVTAVFSAENSFCKLVEVSLADGSQKQLASPQWLRISGLAWPSGGKGLILTGRDLETTLSQIWNVSYPDGEAVRITNDLSSYQGLSVSADGSVIASVQENRNANIWRAAGNGSTVQITKDIGRDEGMSGVAATADGSIVYTTRLKGDQDLSIISPSGQNRQLTQNSRSNFSPVVSPDGKYIVFVSTRAENPTIWRMDIDGENEIQLTNAQGIASEPQITPDGKYVIFNQTDLVNRTTIWRVGLDGTDPKQLSDMKAVRPIISPDGKYIACAIGLDSPVEADKMVILPVEGGEAKQILDIPDVARSRNVRWTADGKAFVYIRAADKIDNLWRQSLSGGEPSAITNFDSMRIYRFSSLGDGGFTISRGVETTDAVLISRS